MKLLGLILGLVLVSSLVLAGNFYTGDSQMVCSKEVELINTGIQDGVGYVIVGVNGEEKKIYEGDSDKVKDVEIYVEAVVDETGAQYDKATLIMGCKTYGYVGTRSQEDYYELGAGESTFVGARELTVLSVFSDSVEIEVNNKITKIGLGERESVGGLSVEFQKFSGNRIILKVMPATAPGYITGQSITGMVVSDLEFGLKSYFANLFNWLKLDLFNFT